MAYKKYIKRNGKLYGPYIYHSRRVNGKVISEYHGTVRKIDYKKFIFIFFGVLLISVLIYGVVSNRTRFTGKVTGLDVEALPKITNLTVTQLHESGELLHKYELNLGVLSSSNLNLNYDWGIDCGYFFVDNKSIGTEYSGYDKLIAWYTTGECVEAVVKVSAIGTDIGQELVQSIFNSEDRIITNISFIQEQGNETEEFTGEINIVEDGEVEVNVEELIVQETISETIKIIEDTLPLSDGEKQILINECGNTSVKSKVRLFNNRTIVRYEFCEMWVENSYDFSITQEELEEQMKEDRIRWLRDILAQILKEEIQEQELGGFEESYSI